MIAIVVWGWADVPAQNAMASEGALALRLRFIDDCLSSKRCQVSQIEVEDPKNLVVGQKLGIDTERTKDVNGDFCLHEKMASEVWKKLAVTV